MKRDQKAKFEDAATADDLTLEAYAQACVDKRPGVPVTHISHPKAEGEFYSHPTCGIATTRGPLGCTWADGEKS